MSSDHHDAPLSRYLRIARRRIKLLVGTALLVPLVALAVSLTMPERYEAASAVLLNRQSLANLLSGTSDPASNQQSFEQIRITQARLASAPKVAGDALKDAGANGSAASLLDRSSVEASSDSDLLTFRVVDPSAAEAQRLADAYAAAYVSYRRGLDTAALDLALAEVNRALDSARGSPDEAKLRDDLVAKQQQLQTLRALQTSNAQVVAAAEAPRLVQPTPVRNALIGLFLGVLLGAGLALVRDMLDTRVRSADEISELLGLPVLARLGKPPLTRQGLAELVMLKDPGGPSAEGFRILRTSIQLATLERPASVIMVSSSLQGEGKSTTIANLAVALARADESVILVDLDLRRSSIDRLFAIESSRGLTSVVHGSANLDEATTFVALTETRPGGSSTEPNGTGVSVLTTGPIPPDPGEFAGDPRLRALIQELRLRYRWVLIDAPPLLGVSDPMVIASSVDAMFVVTRVRQVRRPMLRELRRLLHTAPVPVLGHVVTDADADDSLGYGYGYSHGYGYGYGPELERGNRSSKLEPSAAGASDAGA